MNFLEIFRFEIFYQFRRVSIWLYFAVLTILAFLFVVGNYVYDARSGDFFVNSPIIIANVMVFGSLFWLLIAAPVAGDAAARDVQTRMYPLVYTSPISNFEYLAGRFFAAFVINALLLLALPFGFLIAIYFGGIEMEILGQFRLASYLTTYGFIALPNAFAATAIQFSLAALNRRTVFSYFGGVFLFVLAFVISSILGIAGMKQLALLLDPIGINILGQLTDNWTAIETNTRLVTLEGSLLTNRLFWLGTALFTLFFTVYRFRFTVPNVNTFWSRLTRRKNVHSLTSVEEGGITKITSISIPKVKKSYGLATHIRQTLSIAQESFWKIAKSPGGIVLVVIVAFFTSIVIPLNINVMGVPILPKTEAVLRLLTSPLTNIQSPWTLIPLLTIFYAGEIVWREREAGINEIVTTSPVPEWISFLGKFLGLALMLLIWLSFLMTAGILAQASVGGTDLEIGLYLKILFGFQFADYLLFAALALVLHTLINQKYIGYLAALVAYGMIAFGSNLGIEHHLLVYSSDPGWTYTEMQGFDSSFVPWFWFKFYWAAWAFLLAATAILFQSQGKDSSFKTRLQLAQRRFKNSFAWITATAVGLILIFGGFIFYNTNILNKYQTTSDLSAQKAEYELRYGKYKDVLQPHLTGTNLRVELYPEQQKAEIRGSYRLENKTLAAIDSIHLTTSDKIKTGEINFDRNAKLVTDDKEIGYRIYNLEKPLQPGESLKLNFELHKITEGFTNGNFENLVIPNGIHFTNEDFLPAVGYQPNLELNDAGDRSRYGLSARPAVPSLDGSDVSRDRFDAARISFDAIIGTNINQTAVAPGELRRSWTENGRRYFQYATDTPIRNEYAFFSAVYEVYEANWNDVQIQIFHHPEHTFNLERMVEGIRASLGFYTEQFGSYPYKPIRFIEYPGAQSGLHADAMNITYLEGFSYYNPADDPRNFDLIFAVAAHEVAHQWWGNQLTPALVEGAPFISESLAWYSAFGVLEKTYGKAYLNRFLGFMREPFYTPERAAVPLLRTNTQYLGYRRGPLAIYALSEYIGREKVDSALRNFLEKYKSGMPPLATSLDLYRELQAVTPDDYKTLLSDLIEKNTLWELETKQVAAKPVGNGKWQITLDIEARKVVVDKTGVEAEIPMNDQIQIGVFAADKENKEPLYLRMHRISSGKQTITVKVSGEPKRAGIDPFHRLIDLDPDDNIKGLKTED